VVETEPELQPAMTTAVTATTAAATAVIVGRRALVAVVPGSSDTWRYLPTLSAIDHPVEAQKPHSCSFMAVFTAVGVFNDR
jgi:hypothetical protein